jgi:hypothetical protein
MVVIILAIPLSVSIASYEGNCVSFEPPTRPCALSEYLGSAFLLTLVYFAFGRPLLCIGLVVLILLLPLVGFLVGRRDGQPTTLDQV